MKSLTLLLILLFLLINTTHAQNAEQTTMGKTNLYLDAGFHLAGQASINIENQIYTGEKVTWYGRFGLGAMGIIMVNGGPGGLAGFTMLTGKNNNHFEINAGGFIYYGDRGVAAFPLIDLGYRFQKPEGGFIFKAKGGLLGIGIGLGYAF